jgi:hypothetical protein
MPGNLHRLMEGGVGRRRRWRRRRGGDCSVVLELGHEQAAG